MASNKRTWTMTRQLKKAVEASGLTINKLAVESGVPQPVLHRFMAGERGISLATAEKLATYLGLKLS
jgi:plasmid maintenance system antidote protein VapI